MGSTGERWGWGMQTPLAGIPLTTDQLPARILGTCAGQSVFAGQWMHSFEGCSVGSGWQLDTSRRPNRRKATALTGLTCVSAAPGAAPPSLQADGTVWRQTGISSSAAIPGLTGINAIGGDFRSFYAIAAG